MTTEPTVKRPTPVASDFMTQDVRTVPSDMPLEDVVHLLLKHGISNAPVIDASQQGKRLVGFISERDCLAFLSNEAFFGNPAVRHTAGSIMRKHPMCVAPDTDLFAMASIFVSHDYRHLPVTEQEQLRGIVSRRDILRALDKHYRDCIADDPKHPTGLLPKNVSSYQFRVAE